RRITRTQTRQEDAIDSASWSKMTSNPRRRCQGDNRDRKDFDRVVELGARCEFGEHTSQRRLGQFAGNKQDVRARHCTTFVKRRFKAPPPAMATQPVMEPTRASNRPKRTHASTAAKASPNAELIIAACVDEASLACAAKALSGNGKSHRFTGG